MRLLLTMALLAVASPAAAQTSIADDDAVDGATTTSRAPSTRESLRTPGRQTARTAYGYRLTAPDEEDDPSDRRVLRRLNTRLNNRLETRIERYRFVDTRSARAGTETRNPYAARPAGETTGSALVARKRPNEDR